MFGPTRSALLSTLLLAAAIVPLGALGSLQYSSMPLDKRGAVSDGSECYIDYARDPQNCPIVNVAFFEDTDCRKPLPLVRTTPQALIKGNAQMLFDGAVAHSLQRPFGSLRVLAAVPGIGIGFAKGEESDTVVQNSAWLSSTQTYNAFKMEQCITFPNLDASQVKVWTAKADAAFNQHGFVWNHDNVPIKKSPQCSAAKKRGIHAMNLARSSKPATKPECLSPGSWGGGGVLLMYTSDDCSGTGKRQLYSAAQCSPLVMTNFKSFKAIDPSGSNIGPVLSPVYYDLGENGYHACAQHDVSALQFKPNQCQKVAGGDAFVGVYGVDPAYPQPGPGPKDKVLLQGHGNKLLSPAPKPPKHRRR